MIRRLIHLLISAIVLSWVAEVLADVQPASLFQDNMVLQRGMKVPVWGTAAAGEKVTVRFAGQSVSAIASQQGKWKVELAPLQAVKDAKPQELTIVGQNT